MTQNFGRQRAASLKKDKSRLEGSARKLQGSKAIDDLIEKDVGVKKVFEEYENLLQLLVKYFGMQGTDKKVREKEGFGNLEQNTKQLNQKEFAMLCSQRGLVPDYISPDDLVFVFKSCSNDKQLIGYEEFKQAIVKICAISQNKAKVLEETLNSNALKKDNTKDKEPSLIEG